ncbi:hypothetical protein AWA1501_31570 [Lactiplantibacillus pentosus]|nr:hypothetical protein AWA1501_31570 [Lactiplantibacillus pentosus]
MFRNCLAINKKTNYKFNPTRTDKSHNSSKKAKAQESTEASHICFKNRFKASYKLPYKGYVG